MQRLIQNTVVVLGISLMAACDRDGLTAIPGSERVSQAALAPSVVGSYTGSVVARTRTQYGQRTYTCPFSVNVQRQDDEDFSGTFAVRGGRCDPYSGTVDGRVQDDGEIDDVTADTPGGGDNIFEDAEERTGCNLVSKNGFDGAIAGNVLTLEAEAVYDCPSPFGEGRTFVNLGISATRR